MCIFLIWVETNFTGFDTVDRTTRYDILNIGDKIMTKYKGFIITKVNGNYTVQLSGYLKRAAFPTLASAKSAVNNTILAIKAGILI